MDTAFDRAFARTVGMEGGYSDNPNDSGGKTKWGITEAVARAHGYTGEMRDLPIETAKAIYRHSYWDISRLDEVAAISEPVAAELFDHGVNCGVEVPVKFLQRALNVMNRQQMWYPDVAADGHLGSGTVAAFRMYMGHRAKDGEKVMLLCLNCLQGAKYIDITEKNPKDEDFIFGWMLQRVAL